MDEYQRLELANRYDVPLTFDEYQKRELVRERHRERDSETI